jgi:hypothetical protein
MYFLLMPEDRIKDSVVTERKGIRDASRTFAGYGFRGVYDTRYSGS